MALCSLQSCHFTPATQAQFIAEHLGPTLAKTHPKVKLLALDDNKDLLERWMGTVYGGAASKFVAGAGLHWCECTALLRALSRSAPGGL